MKKIPNGIMFCLILIGVTIASLIVFNFFAPSRGKPIQLNILELVCEGKKPDKLLVSFDSSAPLNEQMSKLKDIQGKNLVYESYDVKTKTIIDKSFVKFKKIPGGKLLVHWSIENGDYIHKDHFLLDERFNTLKWEVFESDNDTKYTGIREGNKLILDGKHNGKKVSKVVSIDGKPFYYNPKVSLRDFVYSDKNYIEFWSLRNDKLEKYKMKAIKKGIEKIMLRGQEFEVVKVYWAATGIGEKFFKRTYYFRRDDAMFLTQDATNGWSSDLVIEQ